MCLHLRGHSYKQHVRSSEDNVRAVTQPDVPQCVHDEHTDRHQHGQGAQGQFPPQIPMHR